jgi:glycosyltransferase involved in cell wall biosynthesis
MKILILASNLSETGGIQEYNKNLLKALKLNKADFSLIERKKSKLFFSLRVIFKTIFYRPKFIFCGHINFSPLCLFINKIFKVKFIIFTHGIDVWNIKNNLYKKSIIKAEKIISVSKFTAQKIKDQFIDKQLKQFILPNTVDSDKFKIKEKPEYLIKKYNLDNKKIIFSLARLSSEEAYKGYDRVIEALPNIINKNPNTVFILGGKGDDKERIEKIIKDLGVENNVILAGFIPDEELPDYYNLADVFVMPSKGEGFGIVFLESLVSGTPVIVGNKDASCEAILNGKTGLLVDPDNIKEIENSILSVLNRSIPKEKLDSNYLRNETINNFGFDVFVNRVNNLLNEL